MDEAGSYKLGGWRRCAGILSADRIRPLTGEKWPVVCCVREPAALSCNSPARFVSSATSPISGRQLLCSASSTLRYISASFPTFPIQLRVPLLWRNKNAGLGATACRRSMQMWPPQYAFLACCFPMRRWPLFGEVDFMCRQMQIKNWHAGVGQRDGAASRTKCLECKCNVLGVGGGLRSRRLVHPRTPAHRPGQLCFK